MWGGRPERKTMGIASRSTPHVPPAVRFPLARSLRLLAVLLILVVAGLGTMVASQWNTPATSVETGWVLTMATAWCIATATAMTWWWRSPAQGWLAWNGVEWTILTSGSEPRLIASDSLTVAMDFQWAVLLSCQSDGANPFGLWLEKSQAPKDWLALRRAAYAGGPAGQVRSDTAGV